MLSITIACSGTEMQDKLMPSKHPGVLSISTSKGPVAFFTASEKLKIIQV